MTTAEHVRLFLPPVLHEHRNQTRSSSCIESYRDPDMVGKNCEESRVVGNSADQLTFAKVRLGCYYQYGMHSNSIHIIALTTYNIHRHTGTHIGA